MNLDILIKVVIGIAAFIGILYYIHKTDQGPSTYQAVTHKNIFQVMFNPGRSGEYDVFKNLSRLEAEGAKFLFNCYLPKENGETAEIDVLMIYKSGIYVFESKNYSGWIFGDERQQHWMQTFSSRSGVKKYPFLNPIIQNQAHINALKKQITENIPIHSIVVFSDICTFKEMNVNNPRSHVIKQAQLLMTVNEIDATFGYQLSPEYIDNIYERLYGFSQVSDEVKARHNYNANKRHSRF